MKTVFKLKANWDMLRSKHIHATFFCGNEGQTLANLGTLIMGYNDYHSLKCALDVGGEEMKGHVEFIFEEEGID